MLIQGVALIGRFFKNRRTKQQVIYWNMNKINHFLGISNIVALIFKVYINQCAEFTSTKKYKYVAFTTSIKNEKNFFLN